MTKRVFGIVGRKRCGKDTVADIVCETLGCKKYALATPLKELVCNLFGITMEQLDQYKNEHWDLRADGPEDILIKKGAVIGLRSDEPLKVSFRSILQKCGDSQKNFFGLDCYMRKFHEKLLHEDVIVVPDVRLLEEQKWLMAHTDVTFIKVTRKVETDRDSAHRTESEVDELGFDVLIENNGTMKELTDKINKIIR